MPVSIVCPACRANALERTTESIACTGCGAQFGLRDGFPDLVLGDRFPDETTEQVLRSEEDSNRDTVNRFWVPLLRQFLGSPSVPPTVLSVGCGIGVDVDVLRSHGFDGMGIDCGKRTESWAGRDARDALVMANAMRLPFEDEAFDATFCGCVYPHVGVVGDSTEVAPGYRQDRLALAREMIRVLKPGGRIFVSGANRRCPIDIFHGREPESYRPRFNAPSSPFLLSVDDYRDLFETAGASFVTALPVQNYWGFVSSRKTMKGMLLSLPVRAIFRLVSLRRLAWLRGSSVDPWIVVTAQKPAARST